jgi:hypothetical protein
MLIINADDWGRSVAETDAALKCCKGGRITSLSAMVFMEDSERAADLAKENQLDVGLHLNFSEKFTANQYPQILANYHHKIVRFLRGNRYAQLLYNPFCEKNSPTHTKHRLVSSRVCTASHRHTLTDIITCIFAPTFF